MSHDPSEIHYAVLVYNKYSLLLSVLIVVLINVCANHDTYFSKLFGKYKIFIEIFCSIIHLLTALQTL